MIIRKFIFVMFLLLIQISAFGWGMIGHRVVGGVAWENLTARSKAEVQELLGKESMPMSANWADFIKSDSRWDVANPWHYVNFPKGAKTYNFQKASKEGDILQAIVFFEKILRDKKQSKEKRAIALKFLVHLVGDIHQPLHAGLAEDWGGNKIEVTWFKTESNLHRVWDEHLVEYQQLSYTEYVNELNKMAEKDKAKLMRGTVLDWSMESLALLDSCYEPGVKKLGYDYNFKHVGTLNRRLLEGGLRLAGLLNRVFEGRGYTPDQQRILDQIPQNIKVPW